MLKFVVGALFIASIAGCQKLTDYPMVKINGEVTLDNRALEDTFVVFLPLAYRTAGSTINPIAYGKTDQTGQFELQVGDEEGIRLGKYRVLIFGQDAGGQYRKPIAPIGSLIESEPLPFVSVDGRSGEETVPSKYNLHSELEFEVSDVAATMYPKFALSSD